METNIENIVSYLKEIIDKNGYSYIKDKPYDVYSELIDNYHVENKIAAAILYFLITTKNEINYDSNFDDFSKTIQKECSLNKKMADIITSIMFSLYSKNNKKDWMNKESLGLKEFLNEDFVINWKGETTWDCGQGTVDCHYKADIVLRPTKDIKKDKQLETLLKNNPFLTKKKIYDLFKDSLENYLDEDFEYYCTCDDYYEPYVEDFNGNLDFDIKKWCENNGFNFISCDGDGYSDEFEPKDYRHW